jgi:hypothetical protein
MTVVRSTVVTDLKGTFPDSDMVTTWGYDE